MAELEEWRVFIRDFSDLALARMAKELRQYPEDKPYLHEVLAELKSRDRRGVTGVRRKRPEDTELNARLLGSRREG